MAADNGPETQIAALAALELVPFAMVIADGSAQVRAVNRRWTELTGLTRANSLGLGWLSVLEPEARARLREDITQATSEGRTSAADYQLAGPHGARWARWWVSRHEVNGNPLIAIAAADVHDDYARQANLYHLATHDSLTGLINRSHFIEQIEQALRRNQRQSRHVGVVYVDLDGFKRLNDQGGHALGDRVLFAIGARLRHAVRSADLVARIGGDEFAVLCEGLSAVEQAEVVAGRIAAALNEAIELDGHRWPVSASVGAAVDQGSPDSAEDLVDRADRAMYSVKLTRRSDDIPEGAPEAVEPSSTERLAAEAATRARPEAATPPVRPPVQTGSPEPAPTTARSPEPEPTDVRPEAGPSDVRREPEPSDVRREPEPSDVRPEAEPSDVRPEAEPSDVRREPEPTDVRREPEPTDVRREPEPTDVRREPEPTEVRREPAPLPPPSYAPPPSTPPHVSRGVQPSGVAVAEEEQARQRLMDDVVSLRHSLESIRSMLDRLLANDTGVIDIRERQDVNERD